MMMVGRSRFMIKLSAEGISDHAELERMRLPTNVVGTGGKRKSVPCQELMPDRYSFDPEAVALQGNQPAEENSLLHHE